MFLAKAADISPLSPRGRSLCLLPAPSDSWARSQRATGFLELGAQRRKHLQLPSPGSKASSAASPSSKGLHSCQISSLFRGISASPHPPLARPSCLWPRRAPTRREPRVGGSGTDASILLTPGPLPTRLPDSASTARPSPGPAAAIRAAPSLPAGAAHHSARVVSRER